MNELLEYKCNAKRLGICEPYLKRWNEATSKEDLMNIALDINGVDFLAISTAEGWGLPVDYIKQNFGNYINGKWQRQGRGYTSELYVGYKASITQRSTITLLIGCNCKFYTPKYHVCSLFVSGKSHVTVCGRGKCTVTTYGDAMASRDEKSNCEVFICNQSVDRVVPVRM